MKSFPQNPEILIIYLKTLLQNTNGWISEYDQDDDDDDALFTKSQLFYSLSRNLSFALFCAHFEHVLGTF